MRVGLGELWLIGDGKKTHQVVRVFGAVGEAACGKWVISTRDVRSVSDGPPTCKSCRCNTPQPSQPSQSSQYRVGDWVRFTRDLENGVEQGWRARVHSLPHHGIGVVTEAAAATIPPPDSAALHVQPGDIEPETDPRCWLCEHHTADLQWSEDHLNWVCMPCAKGVEPAGVAIACNLILEAIRDRRQHVPREVELPEGMPRGLSRYAARREK